ncbi:MAG: class I SAM-dependent methyltransferase [Pyrinomonadaceae bacterium]
MLQSDEENLILAESIDSVDAVNARFYGRFTYPWRPKRFERVLDPHFETIMLNQNLGDWDAQTLSGSFKIWVAGCGTNQGLYTALRFPECKVRGSDVSVKSLELCAGSAAEMNLSNLELRRESINQVEYREEFDHVICTGVIHHNADPKATLEKLAQALKPSGVMEMMVNNRYHRIVSAAFQKAVRIMSGYTGPDDFEAEMPIARKIIEDFPVKNFISAMLDAYQYKDWPESQFADALLQPVDYSYTVESLSELAESCGLELLMPTVNLFDKAAKTLSWNIPFNDPELRERYDSLPDLERWQVANLLLHEKSPMVWFYMQRKDSGRARKTEGQVCEEFLDRVFVRSSALQRGYMMGEDGHYRLTPNTLKFPVTPPDLPARNVYDMADGTTPMRDIFARLGIEPTFHAVNEIRVKLTTSAFPYLIATRNQQAASPDDQQMVLEDYKADHFNL